MAFDFYKVLLNETFSYYFWFELSFYLKVHNLKKVRKNQKILVKRSTIVETVNTEFQENGKRESPNFV